MIKPAINKIPEQSAAVGVVSLHVYMHAEINNKIPLSQSINNGLEILNSNRITIVDNSLQY